MTLGQFFFKYRSYTPIPFIIPLLLFGRPVLATLIIGGIFVVIGELIRLWGVSYAGSETRTTDKVGGTNLVTQGPFAYVRNPLYLGNILMYFGISIMANSLFPYLQILSILYFTFQYYFIILEEEQYLREKFKQKYDDYFNSVGRFIPSFTSYPAEKQSNLKQNIPAAYTSEKRTFQAAFISVIMIVLIYFLINQ
ncbi:MAG: isoprenylcysteine carboxylmethyltransferase family protein [Chlorobi bacterium]|nr:isoprenylcysteine carboxylmethyltransferase family protein [Chlorobiota bacterium]MCI0715103.1 isoprenylcysteine carboxylmethyltransferase family protein [Chlorobiota bacterium]